MPLKQGSRKWFLAVMRNPAWICLIWFGMTAGVSLLATPVRFSAPTITRPIALDVGQVVFAALNKAEFVALILLLIVVRVSAQRSHLPHIRRYQRGTETRRLTCVGSNLGDPNGDRAYPVCSSRSGR